MSGWADAAAGIANLGAGIYNMQQGNKAAKTLRRAAEEEGQLWNYLYGQQRNDLAPYRSVGQSSLNAWARAMGLPQHQPNPYEDPDQHYQYSREGRVDEYEVRRAFREYMGRDPTKKEIKHYRKAKGNLYYDVVLPGREKARAANPPPAPVVDEDRYGGFKTSPGYQFRLDEGQKGLDRNMAARGLLNSGARGKALTQYNQNVASDEFNNYMNRLSGGADMGMGAVNSTNQAAQVYGQQFGNSIANAASARASGYLARGNAVQSMVNNVTGAMPYMRGLSGYGRTPGFNPNAPLPY